MSQVDRHFVHDVFITESDVPELVHGVAVLQHLLGHPQLSAYRFLEK